MTHHSNTRRTHAVRRGFSAFLAASMLCTTLPVTAGTPSIIDTQRKGSAMSIDAPRIQPRLSAEQALRRLLELVRTSHSISEFTPQRLEEAMGVPIQQWEKEYGFSERLTPHWTYGFVMPNLPHGSAKPDSLKRSRRQRFDFSFNPRPNTSPDMTEICQLDFEQFSSELEQMGFSRSSVYDSPPKYWMSATAYPVAA